MSKSTFWTDKVNSNPDDGTEYEYLVQTENKQIVKIENTGPALILVRYAFGNDVLVRQLPPGKVIIVESKSVKVAVTNVGHFGFGTIENLCQTYSA